MEHAAKVSQARHELTVEQREIRKLIQAIKDGVAATSIKKELLALESRQADLERKLDAPEMPELLHPRMADVYREKVKGVCEALEREDGRLGATTEIRGLIETIPARAGRRTAENYAEGGIWRECSDLEFAWAAA